MGLLVTKNQTSAGGVFWLTDCWPTAPSARCPSFVLVRSLCARLCAFDFAPLAIYSAHTQEPRSTGDPTPRPSSRGMWTWRWQVTVGKFKNLSSVHFKQARPCVPTTRQVRPMFRHTRHRMSDGASAMIEYDCCLLRAHCRRGGGRPSALLRDTTPVLALAAVCGGRDDDSAARHRRGPHTASARALVVGSSAIDRPRKRAAAAPHRAAPRRALLGRGASEASPSEGRDPRRAAAAASGRCRAAPAPPRAPHLPSVICTAPLPLFANGEYCSRAAAAAAAAGRRGGGAARQVTTRGHGSVDSRATVVVGRPRTTCRGDGDRV